MEPSRHSHIDGSTTESWSLVQHPCCQCVGMTVLYHTLCNEFVCVLWTLMKQRLDCHTQTMSRLHVMHLCPLSFPECICVHNESETKHTRFDCVWCEEGTESTQCSNKSSQRQACNPYRSKARTLFLIVESKQNHTLKLLQFPTVHTAEILHGQICHGANKY